MQKPEHRTNFDRNVVIFAGSALSFILILAILREIMSIPPISWAYWPTEYLF